MSTPLPPGPARTPQSQSLLLEWTKLALLPILIAVIGYFFTSWQKARDDTENNVRLYTQLVSQREQSDSQLRTEMFKAVIEKFLSGGKTGERGETGAARLERAQKQPRSHGPQGNHDCVGIEL